jgi:hypothetical protein
MTIFTVNQWKKGVPAQPGRDFVERGTKERQQKSPNTLFQRGTAAAKTPQLLPPVAADTVRLVLCYKFVRCEQISSL